MAFFDNFFGNDSVTQFASNAFRGKGRGSEFGDGMRDKDSFLGGAIQGGLAGAGTGAAVSGGNPFAAAAGGIAGVLLGGTSGQKRGQQQEEQELKKARVLFEADRSDRLRRESLLEQSKTRSRFAGGASGSLLTG